MKSTGCLFFAAALSYAQAPAFRTHVLAEDLKGGYQVVAADVNGDQRKDLLALASGMTELVWFENPGGGGAWPRHVMASGLSRMINLAACPSPEGGLREVVLAQDFSSQPSQSAGAVLVLSRQGRAQDLWKSREIDRLPTSHRLRCASIPRLGGTVVVNAPLAGAKSEAPEYRDRVPLVYYKPGEWKRRVISEEPDGVMHGIFVLDWDGDGSHDVLSASFRGIHLHQLNNSGRWFRSLLTPADPAPWPKSGSSDIAAGQLRGRRFIASIEPWHGHQLAVYTRGDGGWRRQVIDDSYVDGHTVLAADFDNDGADEIVGGFRGAGRSVYLYTATPGGKAWKRSALDAGGIAAAACDAADFNGDGALDIACIGSATANLKLYENLGKR